MQLIKDRELFFTNSMPKIKESFFTKTLLVFCMFFIIYDFSIIEKFRSITTGRIAVVVLFLIALFKGLPRLKKSNETKKMFSMCVFQLFLLVYTSLILFAIGVGTDKTATITNYIINFVILVPLEFYLLCVILKSLDDLMNILFVVTIIQCFVIVFALVSPSFANFVDNTINGNNPYWDYSHMRKLYYPGGINCITSLGALKLSVGIVPCIYFIQKNNHTFFYFISFLFISFSMIAVARTGFILFLAGLICLFSCVRNKKRLVLPIISMFIILFIVLIILIRRASFQSLFHRLFVLFENGLRDGFLNDYFHGETTVIPNISLKTIIGTGIVSGISGNGVVINADGGFIRMYTAFGLPLAIVFYIMIILTVYSLIRRTKEKATKLSLIFLAIIFLVGEFKEPFFYTRYCVILLFVVSYLNLKISSENILQNQGVYNEL